MTEVITSIESSSDWELTSPARPRRSLPVPPVTMSRPPRKKRNTCAALYAAGIGCSLPPVGGVLWCSRHREERLKLYTNYKAHGALLEAYPDILECRDVATIVACHSLSLLREWNAHLRGKYNLLTRCIEARVYFTRRFFGEDMDFGHKTFWDNLVRKRSDVEQLMFHIETRGYQLILQGQNALWVLAQDMHDTEDCSGYGDLTHDTDASFRSQPESVEGTVIEDPLETILREKATEIREKIRMHLAWYYTPPASRFHTERLKVIYAYVRRAIYKDVSLMFLSETYGSVMALLSDQDLDLITMEKIWHAISALCIHDVQSAVDDVLRSTDGDYVVVLGGKVFKDISGERWPLHAWGHMMAIRHCYSCLRTTCQTIDQVIDLTRYALLTRTPLSQTDLKYDFGFDGSRELILAGFISNDIPHSSPRHSIICKDTALGPVWEETKRNLSLYAGLSLTDPLAQTFVNACIRHPDLMVMLRKGADARIIRSSPVVWTSRRRHARSPSALASMPWEKTTDVVGLSDLALGDAQPSGWGHEKIADCMQVILVDTSEGTMADFVRKLVEIWCQVYNVGDKDQLYDVLKGPYEAAGELEADQEVTNKIALDYYQNLWGCMPSPALAEDMEF